jgi:hypothetical protein
MKKNQYRVVYSFLLLSSLVIISCNKDLIESETIIEATNRKNRR